MVAFEVKGGKAAYFVCASSIAEKAVALLAKPPFAVLSNTPDLQAVCDVRSGLTHLYFRSGGEYTRTHGTDTWAALETAVGALEGGRAIAVHPPVRLPVACERTRQLAETKRPDEARQVTVPSPIDALASASTPSRKFELGI